MRGIIRVSRCGETAAVIPGFLMTAMRLFMWHPNQRGVAACWLQTLVKIDGIPD